MLTFFDFNIEISIIIYNLILRMVEINWIFKRIDGEWVKADSNAFRHNREIL